MYPAISLSLCVISAIIYIIINYKIGGKASVVGKTCASVMFVIGAIIAIITESLPFYGYLFLGGLVLSLAGDVLLGIYELDLKNPNKLMLNLGMLMFGLAQICYFIGMSFHASLGMENLLVPIILASAMGIIIGLLIIINAPTLKVKFGNMLWQSLVYSCLICINLVYSLFLIFLVQYTWITFLAVFFFLASDLILSLMYFGNKATKEMDILNKSTYYIAQILYVVYMFFGLF